MVYRPYLKTDVRLDRQDNTGDFSKCLELDQEGWYNFPIWSYARSPPLAGISNKNLPEAAPEDQCTFTTGHPLLKIGTFVRDAQLITKCQQRLFCVLDGQKYFGKLALFWGKVKHKRPLQ